MGKWKRYRGWLVVGAIAALMASMGAGEPASTQPAAPSVVLNASAFDRAVIIPIRDEITEITKDSIDRRFKKIRADGVKLVILELNTPGGSVMATLEICDAIKKFRDDGNSVYAWVNNKAYSAGTIIALATDGILMTNNATIGDCQPILITGTGADAVPEGIQAKLTSPLEAELRDSARRNGYNLDLVLSLVWPEMQIFWVVNTETDEKRFVDTHERDRLFQLPAAAEDRGGGTDGKDEHKERHRRPEPVPDSESKSAWRYVKKAPGIGEVRQPIDRADQQLLTMRTVEAVAYGFCVATAGNDDELRSFLHVTGAIRRMENTWMESFVEWLASPLVRGVLFLLMLLGAYAEFQHPGFGLPGGVALVALILFLGAPYMAGFTVTWEIVAILLGIALLAVEVFVIPGFGVAGIAGIVLLVIGLLSSFIPTEPRPQPEFEHWPQWPTLPLSFDYLKHGLWALAGGMTGSLIGMAVLARFLPRVPIAGRLIAPNPTREQITVDDPYDGAAQVGDIGKSEGPLRPAGKARFGATLVDVVSEGEYIDGATRVEVIERHGSRVVVRRVD